MGAYRRVLEMEYVLGLQRTCRVDGLSPVNLSDEPENFSPDILEVLLSAYCFASYLNESRFRDFSCEYLTILKGMLRIVAIG